MKVMGVAHVIKDIIIDQFDRVIANITTGSCFGFNDYELPSEGREHNKALYFQ